MAHIDRGYINPYRSFRGKRPAKYRQDLDNWSRGIQVLGAFQPVLDMVRDVSNTFRAYKDWQHVIWDLAQPVRGLLNGIAGVAQIVYSPFYLLGELTIGNIAEAVRSPKGDRLSSVGGNTTRALAKATSWIVNGVMKIVRGVTQVAFTPLSWVKMIARGFSTAENRGVQRLVDDRSIQRLIKQAEEVDKKIEAEKANAPSTQKPSNYAENPDGLNVSLVEKSDDEKKLEAINKALKRKFHKAYERSTGEKVPNMKKRENNGAILNNEHTPKRLAFVGTSKPSDGNYVKFFKDAGVARKEELRQISQKRFGRAAKAA